MDRVIIVGGGQAAGQAAASLRQEGFEGEIRLISEETRSPYQRPPLSKDYLAGQQTIDRVLLRPEEFYAEKAINLDLGVRVESIDPEGHRVRLNDGSEHAYDTLILATGSRVRRLDQLVGSDLAGIAYLRTVEDSDRIRGALESARNVVVVGGGYIGLEVASVAADLASVTVLEADDRILGRVATPALSDFFERLHAEHGVTIRTGAEVTGFAGSGRVERVTLADGGELAADLVVVGVGIVPNVELAEAAGIEVGDGILVDAAGRTSAPDVLAAGDCTNHPSPFLGRRVRLESVPNAMEQARVAAATALGKDKAYDAEPWFWSDQYDVKLQMAGFTANATETISRGDAKAGPFINFHLADGVVAGVEAVNSLREFLACRKLVAGRCAPDRAKLADASIPVKDLLA